MGFQNIIKLFKSNKQNLNYRHLKLKPFSHMYVFTDIEVILKFSQLEFLHGEPERGRTMFESLLNSYPRRLDIWNPYIDSMTKQGDTKAVRYAMYEPFLGAHNLLIQT